MKQIPDISHEADIQSYMSSLHPHLQKGYALPPQLLRESLREMLDPNERIVVDCEDIALNIFKILENGGGKPEIKWIEKADGRQQLSLRPSVIEGDVNWSKHCVCMMGGVVYDPILDEPLASEEYLQQVFVGQAVTLAGEY